VVSEIAQQGRGEKMMQKDVREAWFIIHIQIMPKAETNNVGGA
jgi:hypothetical protein